MMPCGSENKNLMRHMISFTLSSTRLLHGILVYEYTFGHQAGGSFHLRFFVETKPFLDLTSACLMEHHRIKDECRDFCFCNLVAIGCDGPDLFNHARIYVVLLV
ncbi:unnamed protein product [Alopecurus aequalis]